MIAAEQNRADVVSNKLNRQLVEARARQVEEKNKQKAIRKQKRNLLQKGKSQEWWNAEQNVDVLQNLINKSSRATSQWHKLIHILPFLTAETESGPLRVRIYRHILFEAYGQNVTKLYKTHHNMILTATQKYNMKHRAFEMQLIRTHPLLYLLTITSCLQVRANNEASLLHDVLGQCFFPGTVDVDERFPLLKYAGNRFRHAQQHALFGFMHWDDEDLDVEQEQKRQAALEHLVHIMLRYGDQLKLGFERHETFLPADVRQQYVSLHHSIQNFIQPYGFSSSMIDFGTTAIRRYLSDPWKKRLSLEINEKVERLAPHRFEYDMEAPCVDLETIRKSVYLPFDQTVEYDVDTNQPRIRGPLHSYRFFPSTSSSSSSSSSVRWSTFRELYADPNRPEGHVWQRSKDAVFQPTIHPLRDERYLLELQQWIKNQMRRLMYDIHYCDARAPDRRKQQKAKLKTKKRKR